MTSSDDNAAVILEMMRETQRSAERRIDARHAEVEARNDIRHREMMVVLGELKGAFETHEDVDNAKFAEINAWRYKMIGAGLVLVPVIAFVSTAASHLVA